MPRLEHRAINMSLGAGRPVAISSPAGLRQYHHRRVCGQHKGCSLLPWSQIKAQFHQIASKRGKMTKKLLKIFAENRIARAQIWSVYLNFEASSRESQYEERKQTPSRWRTPGHRDTATSIYYFLSLPLHRPTATSHHPTVNLLADLKIILQSCRGLNSWEPVNETSILTRAVELSTMLREVFTVPGEDPYFGHCEIFAKVCWQL